MLSEDERKARQRESMRRWRAANREKAQESTRRWREANPEKAREAQRRAEQNRRDPLRGRTLEQHREYQREVQRRNREADPEKLRTRTRKWREANPEKVLEIGRRYREANREKLREKERNRVRTRRETPEQGRRYRLKHEHGMQLEDWLKMSEDQSGCCYLCGDPLDLNRPRAIHIDHDHSCCPARSSCARCRRGLACDPCNKGIGHFGDDPERMRRVAANLERTLLRQPQRV